MISQPRKRYAQAVIDMIDASNVLRAAPVGDQRAERLQMQSAQAIWDRSADELGEAALYLLKTESCI